MKSVELKFKEVKETVMEDFNMVDLDMGVYYMVL